MFISELQVLPGSGSLEKVVFENVIHLFKGKGVQKARGKYNLMFSMYHIEEQMKMK